MPPAVASVLSLPVWLVFVGTVLLSVVLRWCRVSRAVRRRPVAGAAGRGPAGLARRRRASPRNAPSAGHGKPRPGTSAGGDPPWACRHPDQRRPAVAVPADVRDGVIRRSPRPGHHLPDRGQRRAVGVEVVASAHRPASTGSPVEPKPAVPRCRSPNQPGRADGSPADAGVEDLRRLEARRVVLHPGAAEEDHGVGGEPPGHVGRLVDHDRAVAVGHDGGARPAGAGAARAAARPASAPASARSPAPGGRPRDGRARTVGRRPVAEPDHRRDRRPGRGGPRGRGRRARASPTRPPRSSAGVLPMPGTRTATASAVSRSPERQHDPVAGQVEQVQLDLPPGRLLGRDPRGPRRAAVAGGPSRVARARGQEQPVGPVAGPGGHAVERARPRPASPAIAASCAGSGRARPTRPPPRRAAAAAGSAGAATGPMTGTRASEVPEVGRRERVADAEAGERVAGGAPRPPAAAPRAAARRRGRRRGCGVRDEQPHRRRAAAVAGPQSAGQRLRGQVLRRARLGDQPLVGRQRPVEGAADGRGHRRHVGRARPRRSARRARTSSPPTPAARAHASSRARQAGSRSTAAASAATARRSSGTSQRGDGVQAGDRRRAGRSSGRPARTARRARRPRPGRPPTAPTSVPASAPARGGEDLLRGAAQAVARRRRSSPRRRRGPPGRTPAAERHGRASSASSAARAPSSAASASTASGRTVKDPAGSGCDIAASVVVPAQGGPEATDARSAPADVAGAVVHNGYPCPHPGRDPPAGGCRPEDPGRAGSGSGGGERARRVSLGRAADDDRPALGDHHRDHDDRAPRRGR